jgi:hypothetical protein
VLALLHNIPIVYPSALDTYISINDQATSYPGRLVSLDCSVPRTVAGGLPRSMLKASRLSRAVRNGSQHVLIVRMSLPSVPYHHRSS